MGMRIAAPSLSQSVSFKRFTWNLTQAAQCMSQRIKIAEGVSFDSGPLSFACLEILPKVDGTICLGWSMQVPGSGNGLMCCL